VSRLAFGAAVAALPGLARAPRAEAQELTLVRLQVASAAAVDSVRRLGVDVVEFRPRPDGGVDVLAVAGARDRSALAARGWPVTEVPRAPEAAALEVQRAARGAAAYTVYRDFDDPVRGVAAYLRAFAASRADVSVDSIGASVEGRPILAVKVGAPGDDPGRPNVIYLATYHAREWAATEMALRLLAYLADSLPLQAGGASLLASRDVWVIPVVNPDGYQYTFSITRLWRKNRRPNADGTYGVDLNRNHGGFWGYDDAGSSAVSASEVYRGTAPASEPETQAIEAFHRAHPPVASISYHSYTGAVLYPWAHANGELTGDDAVFRALAGTDVAPAIPDGIPGSVNRYYHPGPAWHLYPINGDYTEWAYRTFRTLAFTVELTSGCCVAGSYYGFEFPDSEPLLERMAADNIPFALSLLRDAGPIAAGGTPAGLLGATPQFESVWPELRVLLDVPAPPSGTAVDVATDSGQVAFTSAARDTLGGGRRFVRMRVADALVADARAVRLPGNGLDAELLLRDGAESDATPWTGFRRVSPGFASDRAWRGTTDTLTSPPIAVAGRSHLALTFWTRHAGSVFAQQQRGVVQLSRDDGPWLTVAGVVGSSPAWYPVSVPLDAAAGAGTVRLRFIADDLDWLVDAVTVSASDQSTPRLFSSLSGARAATLDVSENPVRSGSVTLRWPPGTGTAHVDVFSLTGTRVTSATLGIDPGRWVWDLTTLAGRPVANGAYFVVVTQADGTRLRRRLLVGR